MPSRSGQFRRVAGGYSAFFPARLPPDLELDSRLVELQSLADQAVGRLDGAVATLPDAELFVSMYVRREAVLSSQIEGTHASLMDVLEHEAAQEGDGPSVDVREIWNYTQAMKHGLRRLSELPLSRRLMCEVHEILMTGVRGGEQSKTPGRFRTSQNWIGGASPATARFVPPPAEEIDELFSDLERYLHDSSGTHLIKAGVAHAQFETIHPFLDGNGRTGRLLITFWLIEQGVLRRPVLYPSLFLKESKDEYVDRLQAIREADDWEGWLAFFLDGIAQVASEATETAMRILRLREKHRAMLSASLGRRAAKALAVLDRLYGQPAATARMIADWADVSAPTASALVSDLERLGILQEVTGRSKWRRFRYGEYLDLFAGASDRE